MAEEIAVYYHDTQVTANGFNQILDVKETFCELF